MKEPVLILSDLHLGHSTSRIECVDELRPLIEGAGTVVFNGDTWQELADVFRPRAERLLTDLRRLCAELGVEPVFLSGNHDPGWSGSGWWECAGGKVVVTHGDAVLWAGSPWSREAFCREEALLALWAEHRRAADDAGERLRLARKIAVALQARRQPRRGAWRRVFDALRPPRRAVEILHAWWRHGECSAQFGKTYFPEAEIFIMGHFHCRGIFEIGPRMVINTGAYVVPHGALWVEWQSGWLRCGRVARRAGFQRGEILGVWRLNGTEG
ncbi:MAG: metallophosphoesterase [Verrucomicrobiales bacterium]